MDVQSPITPGSAAAASQPVIGQPVRCRRERRVLPTYRLPAAEAYPVFFGKRVYQGSSGRVYPLPIYTAVSDQRVDHPWDMRVLSNGLVTVELMPELGGRVYAARHEADGYDLFYRQPVIKPALVGLAGPWISGGIEFNWPQHHRPTTYMPADVTTQRHDDGSCTVWLGEHDAMARMKELHGIRLRPNSSRIELHARLYNRTPMRRTFMWWANVAVEVHDQYQSFFPPDVRHVADHAVRAMSSFPIARNEYYGIDYRPGTDLTWYRNIPVPTSYMVLHSDYAFFGGYDHAADAGFIHVADRHVAPGKKQWTWGNRAFGRAWDRELTDARDDGSYPPYIELMAGVYTNNQPDFSYIEPYETKTFTQCWWPIRGLGPVQNADQRVALRLVIEDQMIRYGTVASEPIDHATLRLTRGDTVLATHTLSLHPSQGHRFELPLPAGATPDALTLALHVGERTLLSYRPAEPTDQPVPPPAKAPPSPAQVESSERLYLIGEHLEQYRHPTRRPEPYWHEALRRDPGDSRAHLALGRRLLGRGLFDDAIGHLEAARERLTQWHPNPESGEAFYLLGLCYRSINDLPKAEAALAKAAWDRRFVAPARYQLAQLHCIHGQHALASRELDAALEADPRFHQALVLRAALLRHAGQADAALGDVERVLTPDPLCFFAWHERGRCLAEAKRSDDARASNRAMLAAMADPSQTLLDVALDYAGAGLLDDARRALSHVEEPGTPIVPYARWWLADRMGDVGGAAQAAEQARRTPRRDLFPIREEEVTILEHATERLTDDAQAPYLLGCVLYDRGRSDQAIACWRRCLERDPSHAGAHRNLGLALFNVAHQPRQALEHFERATAAAPDDARLLYELDQLRGRMGVDPTQRLALLDERADLVNQRDDLRLERIRLLLVLGRDDEALAGLSDRRFHPWEGGEGVALGAHVAARLGLGVAAISAGRPREACAHFEAALKSPEHLGEAKHPIAAEADIHTHLGDALAALGEADQARAWYERAAAAERDFGGMAVQAYSVMTFYKGLALRRLGRDSEADHVLSALLDHARQQQQREATIDYFATSLPNLLVFEEDLQRRHQIEHRFLEALALRGLGRHDEADGLLTQITRDDPCHLGARQMLRWTHLR